MSQRQRRGLIMTLQLNVWLKLYSMFLQAHGTQMHRLASIKSTYYFEFSFFINLLFYRGIAGNCGVFSFFLSFFLSSFCEKKFLERSYE